MGRGDDEIHFTISREIIRRDGGDIRISNRSGGGLIQVVELPTVRPDLATGATVARTMQAADAAARARPGRLD